LLCRACGGDRDARLALARLRDFWHGASRIARRRGSLERNWAGLRRALSQWERSVNAPATRCATSVARAGAWATSRSAPGHSLPRRAGNA
jgi:hypothetical protein